MTRNSRRLLSVLAAATIATTMAACGGGDDDNGGGGGGGGGGTAADNEATGPGMTEDTVTLGGHYPLTGRAAPGYSEIPTGIKAYFDYVNANGGVYDRQIEWVYRDDGYNPTNTSTVVRELVVDEEVFAVMGGLGTATQVDSIQVHWPDGIREAFPGGAVDRSIVLKKGQGRTFEE